MPSKRISSEAGGVVLAQPGHRSVAQSTSMGGVAGFRGTASKTVIKGKGATGWAKQVRGELRNLEQAMRDLAESTGRAQFRPAVLVVSSRAGRALYLRWRAPAGFLTSAALLRVLEREAGAVREWYRRADAQAQLLNAQASAARFALRLAAGLEHAEPA